MASKLSSPKQAIVVVTLVSTIACILNWGFGLVIGAIFAKEIAKKSKRSRLQTSYSFSLYRIFSVAWWTVWFYSFASSK